MDSASQEMERLRRVIADLSQKSIAAQVREEELLSEFSAMNNELITAQRMLAKSNAGLIEAKEEAERANKSKSQFLAMASHELRTPLNGIIGMAELLQSMDCTPAQGELLEGISGAAGHLLQLISNLLDLSQAEAGRLELSETSFSLDKLLKQTIDLLNTTAAKRGNRLGLYLGDNIHVQVQADSGKIKQILLNLLGNAIKFTENGRVDLTAMVVSQGESSQRLRFEVRDTGQGIEEEQQSKLFLPYSRLISMTGEDVEGNGLGLSICKLLIERMGGEIGVESRVGQGTVFWFELDLRLDRSEAAVTAELELDLKSQDASVDVHGSVREVRALIAEDNPLNARLLQLQLEKLGFDEVRHTAHGSQVLELWKESKYSLILLDSQLPGMNGADVAGEIRKCETLEGRPRSPIIGISGDSTPVGKRRMLESGCDEFLLKPVRMEELRDMVQRQVFSKQAPVINSDTVRELKDMSDEKNGIWNELLQSFKKDTPKRMRQLADAIEDHNMSLSAGVAHALKSGALSMGAECFAYLCDEIEKCTDIGDVDRARALLSRLIPVFQETITLFEQD